jgi:hypothetical protein
LTARRDCANEDAVTNLVTGYACAQFIDHSHGLMTNNQPWLNRILPTKDVEIRAANSRQRYTNDSFAWPGPRLLNFFDTDFVFAMKDSC